CRSFNLPTTVSGEPMNTEPCNVSSSVISVRRLRGFPARVDRRAVLPTRGVGEQAALVLEMPHQRRPVGFLGRRIGFGDETGATEIYGRLPGMSGVGPGFAVDVDVLLEHPHILVPHRQEKALAGVASRGEGFDAHRRD